MNGQKISLSNHDIIIDSQLVSTGYFSGGRGTLAGSSLVTSSVAAADQKFYTKLTYNDVNHFTLLYGHDGGSGSTVAATNAGRGETLSVYKSYVSELLRSNAQSTGFQLQGTDNTDSTTVDRDIYIISMERALMKDSLNIGSWTLVLSGSTSTGTGSELYLTDDSKVNKAASGPVGQVFSIYSGSQGSLTSSANPGTKYGEVFPNLGVIALSGTALSSSIPGKPTTTPGKSGSRTFGDLYTGFTADTANDGNAYNALKLANAINNSTQNQIFRSQEVQTSATYFCRIKPSDFNHSSQATFISQSLDGEYAQPGMVGNPQTFISGIQLLNGRNQIVANGRLSTALQNNFSTETIIKVTLTY